MESMSKVREVLRAFSAKRVAASDVMRAVVDHEDWYIPVPYAHRTLGRTTLLRPLVLGEEFSQPARQLLIFSEPATALAAHARGARLGPYEGGISGRELFSRLDPQLDAVVANEGSEDQDKLYLAAPSFGNAAVWADVSVLERALTAPGPLSAELVGHVARFDSYFIALNRHDGSIVTMQNYPGLQNAGVVFTAPDCLETFMRAIGATAEGLETGSTTGERLLSMLPDLGIDGLVINPCGPGVTRPLPVPEIAMALGTT